MGSAELCRRSVLVEKHHPSKLALAAVPILLAGFGFLTGCGSSTIAASSPASGPFEILTQPASQTIPLGSPATFTVSALGNGTLTYQWSLNGQAISGATGSSYTTPATSSSDSNDAFSVTVTESAGGNSLLSDTAKLTIGARSPKAGDLRFQQVDAPTVAHAPATSATNIIIDGNHSTDTFPQSIGSPIEMGPSYYNCVTTERHDCSWNFWVSNQPNAAAALSMLYTCDDYASFNSDLPSLSTSNSVITSLAIPAGVDAYAVAVIASTQSSGFDVRQEVVSSGAIQSTASADGLKSRVITAVAFDTSGQAHLLSYGWQTDATTLYDTTTEIVAAPDIAATASTLAQQGYIITAIGGNEVNGYVLVGTKVQGDTLPRPLLISTQTQTAGDLDGYAPVGFVNYSDPASPQAATDYTALFEK